MKRKAGKQATKRSELDYVSDMAIVLTSKLSPQSRQNFLHSLLWGWSERHGKYEGCKIWSATARHQFKQTKSVKGLRHDHSIPRNMIVEKLINNKRIRTPKDLLRFLTKQCHGVVITTNEDRLLSKSGLRQKMPRSWDWNNPFARHEEAGIKLIK